MILTVSDVIDECLIKAISMFTMESSNIEDLKVAMIELYSLPLYEMSVRANMIQSTAEMQIMNIPNQASAYKSFVAVVSRLLEENDVPTIDSDGVDITAFIIRTRAVLILKKLNVSPASLETKPTSTSTKEGDSK